MFLKEQNCSTIRISRYSIPPATADHESDVGPNSDELLPENQKFFGSSVKIIIPEDSAYNGAHGAHVFRSNSFVNGRSPKGLEALY
jgi:hypothetical protein